MAKTDIKTIYINPEYQKGFPQSLDVSLRNLGDQVLIESNKMAPFLTGALVKSGRVIKNNLADYSVSWGSPSVPYARRRWFENRLNPQTMEWGEKGLRNVISGTPQRWWKSKL